MKRLALGIGILFVSMLSAGCVASPTSTPGPPTLTPSPAATLDDKEEAGDDYRRR